MAICVVRLFSSPDNLTSEHEFATAEAAIEFLAQPWNETLIKFGEAYLFRRPSGKRELIQRIASRISGGNVETDYVGELELLTAAESERLGLTLAG